jgi:hypothetical protein
MGILLMARLRSCVTASDSDEACDEATLNVSQTAEGLDSNAERA